MGILAVRPGCCSGLSGSVVGMILQPGCDYYLDRIYNENPVVVRNKATGVHGVVTRVCPKGDRIPACAFVTYGSAEEGFTERWEPLNDLSK